MASAAKRSVYAAALGETDGSTTFHFLPDKAAQSSMCERPDREGGGATAARRTGHVAEVELTGLPHQASAD